MRLEIKVAAGVLMHLAAQKDIRALPEVKAFFKSAAKLNVHLAIMTSKERSRACMSALPFPCLVPRMPRVLYGGEKRWKRMKEVWKNG